MKNIILIIIIFFVSCTTEPEVHHNDNVVLQKLFYDINFDVNGDGYIQCTELPDSLCVLENGRITKLNLFNLNLNTSIPDEIGNLTELTHLGLKSTSLNGSIPESIGELLNLNQLSLSSNSLIGSIPKSIGNLNKLSIIDISYNNLEDSLPINIGELPSLSTFMANSNNFTGIIPENYCNIENLNLFDNQLCGNQPDCIDTPQKISYQNCTCSDDEEKIDGYCYSIADLTFLRNIIDNSSEININLDIDSSNTIEALELGYQKWESHRLSILDCHLEQNDLTETCNVSANLSINSGALDSLEYLDFQQNSIYGEIPKEFSSLNNLIYLNLSGNSLNNKIPSDLCNIESLFISDNKLCPCYPSCINNYEISSQDDSNCNYCNDGYEQICTIPSTAIINDSTECFNSKHLNVLQSIIDSSNFGLGSMPELLDNITLDKDSSNIIEPLELGSQYWEFGDLHFLQAINLGLSGTLPNNILDLDKLEILHISNNYFSGEIPQEICYFVNLQPLDWSNDGISALTSNLFNNNFCPPYPVCIEPYIGIQDTSNCQ